MVDASRLPQVLAGSRADRLKRPIDAEGVWMRISRSNGIPQFPVRRDELTEELSPVQTLATTALQTAETKLDAGQVLALLNIAFSNLFQEYVLNAGVEDRQVDPIDNREYIYTVFSIETQYAGTFEELALVSNDANETLLDVEYGVYKEYPGRIILVFRDMAEGFPNGIAKIKLVGVPDLDGSVITPPVNLALDIGSVDNEPASLARNSQLSMLFPALPTDATYSLVSLINGVVREDTRTAFDPATLPPDRRLNYPVSVYAASGTPPFTVQARLESSTGQVISSNTFTLNP